MLVDVVRPVVLQSSMSFLPCTPRSCPAMEDVSDTCAIAQFQPLSTRFQDACGDPVAAGSSKSPA